MKNLIIGAADRYGWNELKYWVNSAKKNVPNSDIALAMTNTNVDTVNKLVDEGVSVFTFVQPNSEGKYLNKETQQTPIHVLRFLYVSMVIRLLRSEYGSVITTDTRDVIFQSDPFEYIGCDDIHCGTEGLLYEDEFWGKGNYTSTFGDRAYEKIANKEIRNVGVIGSGSMINLAEVCEQIFYYSVNNAQKICDQAVFNFMVSKYPFNEFVISYTPDDSFVAHLGTLMDNSKGHLFDSKLLCEKPLFRDNKFYCRSNGEPYAIAHQYDRTEHKKIIEEIYG